MSLLKYVKARSLPESLCEASRQSRYKINVLLWEKNATELIMCLFMVQELQRDPPVFMKDLLADDPFQITNQ